MKKLVQTGRERADSRDRYLGFILGSELCTVGHVIKPHMQEKELMETSKIKPMFHSWTHFQQSRKLRVLARARRTNKVDKGKKCRKRKGIGRNAHKSQSELKRGGRRDTP